VTNLNRIKTPIQLREAILKNNHYVLKGNCVYVTIHNRTEELWPFPTEMSESLTREYVVIAKIKGLL